MRDNVIDNEGNINGNVDFIVSTYTEYEDSKPLQVDHLVRASLGMIS